MQVSRALNPRRVARSLVTVLLLTLVQTIVAPISAPIISTPQARAVTGTVAPSTAASGTSITIPAGVTSVTITAVGGAGGKGGDDVNTGKSGTTAGRVAITIAVSPGDVLGLFAGNAGSAGSGGTGAAGGSGGADTFPAGAFSINGTYFQNTNFGGGAGGAAGSQGSSGSGGGAGAASIATINSEIVAIAGGAGGGGGAGSGSNGAVDWNGTLQPNGTNFNGSAGTSLNFSNSCPGSYLNGDGGGGGGGGGGYYGGLGGTAPMRVNECSGTSGSPGGNYFASRATLIRNDLVPTTSEGSIVYVYDIDAVSSCSTTTQTVDIYTIQKITTTSNCTWTVPSSVSVIDLFLVGGGGGGGGDGGGGGGGGATLSRSAIPVASNSTLNLKVGYGGAGGSWGYNFNPISGDSTTVTLATGATFSALGGSGGTGGPSGAGGSAGVATNGGFSGGAGGAGGSCYNVGTTGARGVSNYFYGTLNTYAGGGGGGSCPNGAATTGAAGADGGGAGGYASSGTVNQPGSNGTANLGGGGGGGVATGSGLKLQGGKGGSGVILIRYATNPLDAFPASVASALSGRWTPNELQILDNSRKGWIDASGVNATASITGLPTIQQQGTVDSGQSTGSSKNLLVAQGTTSDRTTFISNQPSNFTIFHVERYTTNGTKGRIVTASGNNWLSGFYNSSTVGAAHYNAGWVAPASVTSQYSWLLSMDMKKYYRANGIDVTYSSSEAAVSGAVGPLGLGINNWYSGEYSDWQFADLLIFNRELLPGEVRLVEQYLAKLYGLTLTSDFYSSETDTAASFDGGYNYLIGQHGNGFVLNDTFTVEMWVNPGAQCASGGGGSCGIFMREYALVTRIYNGNFEYALYGKSSAWEWIPTIPIQSGVWSHITITKNAIGSTFNSLQVYLNGQLEYTKPNSPYRVSAVTSNDANDTVDSRDGYLTHIGLRQGDYDRYYGLIDEIKVWKVSRTQSEIASDMHSNETTSALMQMYWNFNKNSLSSNISVPSEAYYGPSRSDLRAMTTIQYRDVKSISTSSPYTVVTFPRSYINTIGGWRAPITNKQVTALVVGGGGGGGYNTGGGGSGGGVELVPATTLSPVQRILVGMGGVGASATGASPQNGESSIFGTTIILGGNAGSNYPPAPAPGGAGVTTTLGTSGAGGAGAASSSNSGTAGSAGLSHSITGSSLTYGGGGGGGGWATNSNGGAGGSGGGGSGGTTGSRSGKNGTANTGGGGGGGSSAGFTGGDGGSGVIVVRWITANTPSYTKPTNAYLNVGMTETFTTNVAQDSATAVLTRTFTWESTTGGSSGVFTRLKQGTGAANASFSWVPTDTSTSGSQYLYRLIVTDSDTTGLFITDSSTAFAIINPALVVTSPLPSNTLKKRINIARSETFTVSLGTPTYRATLSPLIPGISIETVTANSVVLRIAETATVGTWLETLTVTDSVSASVNIPLTITINPPPLLSNTAEIVHSGQVFNLDFSSTASYDRTSGVMRDISGSNRIISAPNGLTFSDSFTGVTSLASGSSQYLKYTNTTQLKQWTLEAYFRIDVDPAAERYIITSQYTGADINFAMGIYSNRTVWVGYHRSNWKLYNTASTLPVGTWTHVTGLWDGSEMQIYFNGVKQTGGTFVNNASGADAPKSDGTDVYINRKWDANTFASFSYGYMRVYDRALSTAEILQNFNATKDRFATANMNALAPSKKYGTTFYESFTVTAGSDTETVTFANGNRAGIRWETSTVTNQVNLSIQESLTVGTFLDTVTVTDSLGQSTFLPIRMTVTKADTLTVFIDTPTALSYTGSRANFSATIKSIGAVGVESGTAFSATVNFKPGGTTCATGGYCRVGDIGPAGGVIFIDTSTASSDGRIYEAAPQNWTGSDDLASVAQFCIGAAASSNISNGSQYGIGWGDTLTANFDTGCSGGAAQVAADLTLNGFSDWFVPSENEAVRLYSNRDAVGLIQVGSNWTTGNWGYWTSTENSASVMRVISNTSGWSIGNVAKNEATKVMLRPVRAFKSCWAIDTCTALSTTETPTAAGVYSMTPSALANLADLQSKYTNVVYQPTSVTINKVAPATISIPWINTNYPETFTVNFQPTAGNQTIRYSTTNGTASGCVFDYKKIATTSQGTCNITITRAADRNFTADTTTATIFFLTFVNSMPTGQVGSGSTIALNGATSLETSTVQPPSITGLSTLTLSLGAGGTFTITGTGFTGTIIVKFWRNKEISASSGNGTTIDIPVSSIASSGATSGRISVVTAAGQAVSVDSLTITP